MLIFSAIDLYEGKAVRLYQGDYAQMTVYSDKPWELVEDFVRQGVTHLHIVDLEGAKLGEPANMETIRAIRDAGPLFRHIKEGDCVYFVHSYAGVNCEASTVATVEYGAPLTAAVQWGNILGTQFHPEKSGRVGLNILRAFTEWEGTTC